MTLHAADTVRVAQAATPQLAQVLRDGFYLPDGPDSQGGLLRLMSPAASQLKVIPLRINDDLSPAASTDSEASSPRPTSPSSLQFDVLHYLARSYLAQTPQHLAHLFSCCRSLSSIRGVELDLLCSPQLISSMQHLLGSRKYNLTAVTIRCKEATGSCLGRLAAASSSLQRLRLEACHAVTDLTHLAGMPSLRVLHIHDCAGISDIAPLALCPSLQM